MSGSGRGGSAGSRVSSREEDADSEDDGDNELWFDAWGASLDVLVFGAFGPLGLLRRSLFFGVLVAACHVTLALSVTVGHLFSGLVFSPHVLFWVVGGCVLCADLSTV
ncbi:hypothetical protein SUGI_0482650 [Cryptomeria japonica]|nr:hypothetical protein SUGI_0482650 [Cryptomeria japonica]